MTAEAADKIKTTEEIKLPDHLKVWKLDDFLEMDVEQPQRLLEPWLCKGDLWMIYSGPGVGKTFIALNIAFAVASGGKFIHWNAPEPAKVLYIDGEMSQYDMQQRLKGIVGAAEKKRNGDVKLGRENFSGYAATFQDPNTPFPDFSDKKERKMLLKLAQGKDLVVIDNILTTLRGADPDKSKDWAVIQDILVELRKQDTAVILIHHTNKAGDQTGTKAKEAILNGMIELTRPNGASISEGAQFRAKWTKARGLTGKTVAPFTAQLISEDGEPPKWTYELEWQDKDEEVLKALKSHMYTTQEELGKVVNRSKGWANGAIRRLIDNGDLTKAEYNERMEAARKLRAEEENPGPDYPSDHF